MERECVLKVRVVPNAKRDGFEGVMGDGETLRLKISAPAVDGKANAALVRFLAGALGLGRGSIDILCGERSRTKVVRVSGMGREGVLGRLGGSV